MRVVFIEWNGEITVDYISDNVQLGMANMVWQANVRRGEVIAEMSQHTNKLTASREKFFEEIFELGRLYERERLEHAFNETHDSIDD